MSRKLAPALAAGCTVILKAAEDVTALTVLDELISDLLETAPTEPSELGGALAGLDLEIGISQATPDDYPRLAQLTQRTKQPSTPPQQ